MHFLPPSIRSQTLQSYLDNTTTRHNGLDYRIYLILRRAKVNVANRARAFNVVRNTMVNWDKIYSDELSNKDMM
jgi:hypothetical protein